LPEIDGNNVKIGESSRRAAPDFMIMSTWAPERRGRFTHDLERAPDRRRRRRRNVDMIKAASRALGDHAETARDTPYRSAVCA
jgi:hypothetical protein